MQAEAKLDQLATSAGMEPSAKAFMDPLAKKKRGRPPKNPVEESQPGLRTGPSPSLGMDPQACLEGKKALIRSLVVLGNGLSDAFCEGPEGRLPEVQSNILQESGAAVLPDDIGPYGHYIVIVGVLAQWGMNVYFIRQAKIRALREEYQNKKMEPVTVN